MSTFADHPAFQAGRPRERRVQSLKDIYAVLPLGMPDVVRAVWDALHDERAEARALRALEAMPAATQAHVLARSRAIAR